MAEGSARILLVDDNVDAAETLGLLLTALGATISVAHSGRAALAALDAFEPDTVLLDIGMPEMNGYEVCGHLKADDQLVPEELRGIGIRIEDDLLVTADGYRNLSASLPRTSAEVEAWMGEKRR